MADRVCLPAEEWNHIFNEERLNKPKVETAPREGRIWRAVQHDHGRTVLISTDCLVRSVSKADLLRGKPDSIPYEDVTGKFTAEELEAMLKKAFPLEDEKLWEEQH